MNSKSLEELTESELRIDSKVLDLCYPSAGSGEKQSLNERLDSLIRGVNPWIMGGADVGAVIGIASGLYLGDSLDMKLILAIYGSVKGLFLGGILGYAGEKLANYARKGKSYCKLRAKEFLEDRIAGVKQTISKIKDRNKESNLIRVPSVSDISETLTNFYIPVWMLSSMGVINQEIPISLISTSVGLACFNNAYNYLRSRDFKQSLKMAGLGSIIGSEIAQKIIGSDNRLFHYAFYATMLYVVGQIVSNRMTVNQSHFPKTFNELEDELREKIDDYLHLKDMYANKMPLVMGEAGVAEQIARVNKVLEVNMRRRSPREVSVDIVLNRSSHIAARAEPYSKTVRIYEKTVRKRTSAEFVAVYAHEMAHMDLIFNDGAANFFAYRVLEKLNQLFPQQGYDFTLAEEELVAMAHNYTNLLKLSGYSRDHIRERLTDLGLDDEMTKTVLWWTYPSLHLGTMFGLQSIAFGNNQQGGYTLDQYQLYKQYEAMTKAA